MPSRFITIKPIVAAVFVLGMVLCTGLSTAVATTIVDDVFYEGADGSTAIRGVVFDRDGAHFDGYYTGIDYPDEALPAGGTFEILFRAQQHAGALFDSRGHDLRTPGDFYMGIVSGPYGSSTLQNAVAGQVFFTIDPGPGSDPAVLPGVLSSTIVTDGNWHTISASFGSGGLALYVDGVLEDTASSITTPPIDAITTLGDFEDAVVHGAISFLGDILRFRTSDVQNDVTPLCEGVPTLDDDCSELEFKCDRIWSIQSFVCDAGPDNIYALQRDGTPICGSGSCPGAPGSCWGPEVTDWVHAEAGISWNIGYSGKISLSHAQNVQVYGETFLHALGDNTIDVPLQCDVGRVWLNDVLVPGGTTSGILELDLVEGWNHLEWTSYNQSQSSEFSLDLPFTDLVDAVNSSITKPCEGVAEVLPDSGPARAMYLEQNTPNPFNPATSIAFVLPSEQMVSLSIYDLGGRLVRTLLNDQLAVAGRNEAVWRGRDATGRMVPAGVYFYRLSGMDFSETRKLVLLK